MHDLRDELTSVWRTASRLTATQKGGRSVMFIAARDGEGTSSMACSFASLAERRAERAVWLVDLDLRKNTAFKAFEAGRWKSIGRPGKAYDASLNTTQIYTVVPESREARDTKLLTAHEVSGSRLYVSRFRNERLRQGQRVQVTTSPDWWRKLRQIADWTVVDAPSLERSPAGLAMAGQMDGVVLVVEADKTTAEDVVGARREIEAHGGTIIGLVMNRIGADARFADRFGS